MTEHKGISFYNSCVKVPVDPHSGQPTPSYERIKSRRNEKEKIRFLRNEESISDSESSSSPSEIMDNFMKFLESIPDYGQVHHLTNEQFKREVNYLKRKHKLLLNDLETLFADHENASVSKDSVCKSNRRSAVRSNNGVDELTLNGKKCYLEECRTSSPVLFDPIFERLAEDQNLFRTSRTCDERQSEDENQSKEKMYLTDEDWIIWDKLNSDDYIGSDVDSMETRSLPGNNSKEWHPTVPKPFTFTLREEAEKYMRNAEKRKEKGKKEGERINFTSNKTSPCKRRRVRPIPLTSKLPLYDKLVAQKEERSRIIREESALNLMSQVRPFKLECDRRAWRSLARSSPELGNKSIKTGVKFKAKPVPRNLFSTEVYDRMLEDEYYRQFQKKLRAAQLMKSSSLPPSMARRERAKSALCNVRSQSMVEDCREDSKSKNTSPALDDSSIIPMDRYKSMTSLLPMRGNNLAAILRCQVSREKLEREIREKMEEKRREQEAKIRESLVGRNPVWRALRSAARHEHERDISIRTLLRRDEAREQAERHRLQMEMMLDRVTRIPTLFERHSQNHRSPSQTQQRKADDSKWFRCNGKKKHAGQQASSSAESYMDYENVSRSDSGSLTGSSGTPASGSQSTNGSSSKNSEKSTAKSRLSVSKRRPCRGQLKVSINETAELIQDQNGNEQLRDGERSISDDSSQHLRSVQDDTTR